MFFNFFKTPSVKQYEHINIYYDPDKERINECRERVRQEIERENSGVLTPRVTLKKGFLSEQRKSKTADEISRRIRLYVFIGVISMLGYMVAKRLFF